MEDIDSSVVLKEKLLMAGIDEIMLHGVDHFSLRRVASACGASCAAPYKHFKNKDEFIKATIDYVEEKWINLSNQIISVFEDKKERICELCIASVRFKIANPLYGTGRNSFDDVILRELSTLPDMDEEKQFFISALVTGTATLIETGKLTNSEEVYETLRKKLSEII